MTNTSRPVVGALVHAKLLPALDSGLRVSAEGVLMLLNAQAEAQLLADELRAADRRAAQVERESRKVGAGSV